MAEKAQKFYKTTVLGLSVLTDGNPEKVVRFQPFFEKFQGDDVRIGYLATADVAVQKVLDADLNVEEITDKEFEKATGENARPAAYPTA